MGLDVLVATQGDETVIFVPYIAHLFTYLWPELALSHGRKKLWNEVFFDRIDIPSDGHSKRQRDLKRLDITYVEDPDLSRITSVCFLELMPCFALSR